MRKLFRVILPHAAIVLTLVYLVFFLIDRVNHAMAFINNDITKALILILGIISVINSLVIIIEDRERTRRILRNDRQQGAAPRRPSQPSAHRTGYSSTASRRPVTTTQRPVRRY